MPGGDCDFRGAVRLNGVVKTQNPDHAVNSVAMFAARTLKTADIAYICHFGNQNTDFGLNLHISL